MKLGNTGLTISRLRMRTMTFGVQTDEDISLAILNAVKLYQERY
ncbi:MULTISPECIES: hypothetical protein [Mycetohabitans]|uniref:Uncharacterized protein n=1 Tax=Mycetohabitans endofungorum TaxID=417203 RepID=A0A2P5KAQ7_9BURK|nr:MULTISPECIES: hypothetical protein [Mycetohabitans]PPB83808.1 hypothetical protein B0O95_106199 [Mycetohabitans endofungorum]